MASNNRDGVLRKDLSIDDLREGYAESLTELKVSFGLEVKGNKNELLARLVDYMSFNSVHSSDTVSHGGWYCPIFVMKLFV